MNCFAHSIAFFDKPYFAVGTCVPDWLTACDRKCRARKKRAALYVEDDNPIVRNVAAGVVRHHEDDFWFHGSAAFTKLNMEFAIEYREQFGNSQSMRASLIGHIIIEMFLDAYLESQQPGAMEQMYVWVAELDVEEVQNAINLFATKPTTKLADEIKRFGQVKYLLDYLNDQGVLHWMNKVLGRLGLELMPETTLPWLAEKRIQVYQQAERLLAGHELFKSGRA